ncbi:MAG: thymidylate synthase [Minisyncoccia bacterium]
MEYVLEDYDAALQHILRFGYMKPNLTGVRAKTIFGIMSRYPLEDRFPLLTRRKVWPKAIWAELLWFLSGSTNNKDLQALGSNIWTPWVSKEFEDKWHYEEGALGPVYGFQLRHFGGYYPNKHNEACAKMAGSRSMYGMEGYDQLTAMVNTLRQDPDSRRNLFSLWNPHDIPKMRLPPCHYTYQVYVEGDRLTGMLTQRSCDFPVGIPANIQFYSTLTVMLAQQVGLRPYEFVHSTADSHIYEDQIPAVEEYLSRPKTPSPRLELTKADDITSYTMYSFKLTEYEPQAAIKIPVAV